jgi:chromosome segregation protein
MSGGEKTMASLSFLFAIMQHYASPFYVLDEIDAALDKANTKKVANLIKKYSKNVQFIVISHNDFTIAEAEKVFGVSMEDGVSRVFGIDMTKG